MHGLAFDGSMLPGPAHRRTVMQACMKIQAPQPLWLGPVQVSSRGQPREIAGGLRGVGPGGDLSAVVMGKSVAAAFRGPVGSLLGLARASTAKGVRFKWPLTEGVRP